MKQVGIPLILAALAVSTPALAQETLSLAGYGGSFQKMMEEEVLPPFEAEHDVKITYVAGRSAEIVAKLQAQKGNQEINVAIVDDGPMFQAIEFGFCDAVSDAPVYSSVYDLTGPGSFSGKAVGIGLVATGITYNSEAFEKNGWAAPKSWDDLLDLKFKQRASSSPIGGTYGLHMLVKFAQLNGGGEDNIEPGFDLVREKLVPNILSWTSSNDQLAQMFQNGEIDIAVWGSGRALALKKSGFPVDFVYPEEGAVALRSAVCPIVDNSQPELSQALVQYLVSPEVQAKLAAGAGFGPVNKDTQLTDEVAASVPYGPETVNKMTSVDWMVINERRADWTNEWNRTVER